jgi:hypothetical protein
MTIDTSLSQAPAFATDKHMQKYIIFRAEKRQPGWEDRKLQHTQGLTKILAEYFDSSDEPIPEVGYRPTDFVRVEECVDPLHPLASTHYRKGDWEVVRVETFTPDIPVSEFDTIVICYCEYNPIDAPLKPIPERQTSLDSFGGNKDQYRQWLEQEQAEN